MPRRPSADTPSLGSTSFEAALRWLDAPGNSSLLRGGLRGVEKESLRVTPAGQLSAEPHPRAWGAALTHPYLTTDYSEALPEFVTPPQSSNWQTLQFLCDLHVFAHRAHDAELLWPASMPCTLGGSDPIPIAYYGTSNQGLMKTVYRRGLGYRYGKSMQAIAGVHFNYSPPLAFWPAYREHSRAAQSEQDVRSAALMGLVRNYRRYSWLVTYLFGASPALDKSLRPEGHALLTELDSATWHAPYATSLRMSDLGYRNKTQARFSIAANSLAQYVDALAAAVSTKEPRYEEIGVVVGGEYRQLNANVLQIENEYYSTIRPKPSKEDAQRPTLALRSGGVAYVEIRTLDLAPADPCGIGQTQLRFLEALLLYCLLEPSPPIAADEQAEIDRRDVLVAREGRAPGLTLERGGRAVPLVDWGRELMDKIDAVAALLDADREGYRAAVAHERAAVEEPERTPSARLLADLAAERQSFVEYALELARRHQAYFRELALAPERYRRLADVAANSLEEAAALERADAVPFEQYLAAYFARA